MPLISFTDGDVMLAVVADAKWYRTSIVKIDGPTASSSGKSINFFFDFRIDGDEKYNGKECRVAFSSGSNAPSLLGNLMWFPTAHIRSVIAAVKRIPALQVPKAGNELDDLLNQPLDCKWDVVLVDGAPTNVISAFLPEGTSVQKPAF